MNGQGSPRRSNGLPSVPMPCRDGPKWLTSMWVACRLILLISALSSVVRAEDVSVRMRVIWGGTTERLWRGSISIPNGEFRDLRLLGLSPEQPGTFIVQGNRILITSRFPQAFPGFEVTVVGSSDQELAVSLVADQNPSPSDSFTVPIKTILGGDFRRDLGAEHTIRIARPESDRLRFSMQTDSLVFQPGKTWPIEITPHELGIRDKPVKLRVKLKSSRQRRSDLRDFLSTSDDSVWSESFDLRVDENGDAPASQVSVPIPSIEGVYDLEIDLVHRPIHVTSAIAERTVQFVVVDELRQPELNGGEPVLVDEFDLAAPSRFDRLTKSAQWNPLLVGRRSAQFSHPIKTVSESGKQWAQLVEDGWVAYPLQLREAGIPHELEIQFPLGQTEDVSVSVLDANVDDSLPPLALHTGISLGDPDFGKLIGSKNLPKRIKEDDIQGGEAKNKNSRHRILFWPRTTNAVVVIHNRGVNSVRLGPVRVSAYPDGLPNRFRGQPSGRRRIAMLDRPAWKALFLAEDGYQEFPFEDWNTFVQVANRMTAYLRYAGYDGVTIPVAAHGSSLFPSKLLRPTPAFDMGIHADTGQDPVRKDVLELLFRVFDREGLMLIPSIEFATPMPGLELKLAQGTQSSQGIELVDSQGRKGETLQVTGTGKAPYYNPLNADVQSAIKGVTGEVASRYAQHTSFGGIRIYNSSDSYTCLPDADWAFDRLTLQSFAATRKEKSDAKDLAQRLARSLTDYQTAVATGKVVIGDEQLRSQWLEYRSKQMTELYRDLGQIVTRHRPNSRLYISTTALTDSPVIQRFLRRTRTGGNYETNGDDPMLSLGFDREALSKISSLTFMQPVLVPALSQLMSLAANEGIAEINEKVRSNDASEFLMPVRNITLPNIGYRALKLSGQKRRDESERGQDRIDLPFAATGNMSRRAMAHRLAESDQQLIFQGGAALLMSDEQSAQDFVDVFRSLPQREFKTLQLPNSDHLVVRKSSVANETIIYFVNDSPWTTEVILQWKTSRPVRPRPIGASPFRGWDRNQDHHGTFLIEPYGLFAMSFADEDASLLKCESNLPRGLVRQLSDQYEDILSRVGQVKSHRRHLDRVLMVAHVQQKEDDYAGCYRTLTGYWPRFVMRNTKAIPEQVATRPRPPTKKSKSRSRRLTDPLRGFIPSLRF